MINGNVQNHGIVPIHDFPRLSRFVRRNGPDTEAILTQNVIPVISVQSILYQLPYGAKQKCRTVFSRFFAKNPTIPYRIPKEEVQSI